MSDRPITIVPSPPPTTAGRKRARDLGIVIGRHPPGPLNAITDVTDVKVGHTTLLAGEGQLVPGKGPVRTGVTAVLPTANVFFDRVMASAFVLNGAGEVSGLTQVQEWGLLETPILLTNTMSVGKVSDAAVKWMTRRFPGIGDAYDVIIPIVGECDDSFLSDVVGRHIRSEHVYGAIERATGGPVREGAVGAGTGMVTCDFKAGIGTASRRVPGTRAGEWNTIGVLVLSNFGVCHNLRVDGVPVGALLEPVFQHLPKRQGSYGSIICVVATDTPLLPVQLGRLAKRAALGLGRAGSYAAHGSGEIVIAFSTANKIPRQSSGGLHAISMLPDESIGPHYEAVVEATEEAIVNSLCMAQDMTGQNGNFAPALPLDRLVELMARYRPGAASPGPVARDPSAASAGPVPHDPSAASTQPVPGPGSGTGTSSGAAG